MSHGKTKKGAFDASYIGRRGREKRESMEMIWLKKSERDSLNQRSAEITKEIREKEDNKTREYHQLRHQRSEVSL